MVLGSLTELVKRGKDGTAVVAKARQTEVATMAPRPGAGDGASAGVSIGVKA